MHRTICLLALVGCSGAVATYDIDDAGNETPDTGDASASSSSSSGGSSGRSSTSSSSSSSSGEVTSSSSSSSGDVEDSGVDAEVEDAGEDASEQDAEPDAAVEPPECTEGAERCVDYGQDRCVGGRWTRQQSEACCFTEGRYVDNNGGWYTDTSTSNPTLSIHRDVRLGLSYSGAWNQCVNMMFARLPTRAEVLSQALPSGGACVPGLDQQVFRTVTGADPSLNEVIFYYRNPSSNQPDAPAKCVNMVTGAEVNCAAIERPAYFCVR